MTDFKLQSNFEDLANNGSDFLSVSGAEEVAQRIRVRLKSLYTEWEYDRRLGLPRVGKGSIFDSSVSKVIRLAMLRKYIADTEGVSSVLRFDATIDEDEHRLYVAYEVKTIYGNTEGTFEE